MSEQARLSLIGDKEKTLRFSLILGLVFMIPGGSAFLFSNSITILADFLISTIETVAIFFSWFAIRRITRGMDYQYNYGYGKLEAIASLVTTAAIVSSFGGILFSAWHHFVAPVRIQGAGILISVSLNFFALVMNSRQWYRNHRIAKREPSPIIDGQIRLFRNKILSSLCVLSTLGISMLLRDFPWACYIDPAGSLVLSGFLIHSAFGLFHVSMSNLLDKTLEEPMQMEIMKTLAKHFDRYKFLHDLRSRRSGGDVFIELFVEFEEDSTMGDVMQNVDVMKKDLGERIPGCHVNVILTRQG